MSLQSEFVVRHRVVVHEEYWCEIDEYVVNGQQVLLCHIRFAHLSPSIFKRLLREWRTFRSVVKCPLYAFGELADDKWHRFVSHLGFVPTTHNVVCTNGQHRPIYISKVD